MTAQQKRAAEDRGTPGRLVAVVVVLIAGAIGLAMLGWMLSVDRADTVDFENSAPTQQPAIFPPPIED